MSLDRSVQYEVVLRDGGGGYWLTIEPHHPTFADEYILSRIDLHARAIAVLVTLGRAVVRDETTDDGSNVEETARYFASREPWANNIYVAPTAVDEPSFFDAYLMPE